jgi:hypothetical protein
MRHRCGWDDITKMDHKRNTVCESVNCIQLAQGRDQWLGSCVHCNEHSVFIKGTEFLD